MFEAFLSQGKRCRGGMFVLLQRVLCVSMIRQSNIKKGVSCLWQVGLACSPCQTVTWKEYHDTLNLPTTYT